MEPKLPVPQLVLAGNSSSGLKKMKVENLKDLHLEFIILGGCMTSMFFFQEWLQEKLVWFHMMTW